MLRTISGILLAQMQSRRSIQVFRPRDMPKGLEFMANGSPAAAQTNPTSPVVAVRNNVADGLQVSWSDAPGLYAQLIPAALPARVSHDNAGSILDMYWRWWKFGNQAYPSGIRLRSVIGTALFIHFRFTFLDPAKADLRSRRFDLLALDFLALGHLPYGNFGLWWASNSAAASQRSAAGA
jgi:hypothetical protein